MNSLILDYRCVCNHLLFKGLVSAGSRLQIKCKKCGKIVDLRGGGLVRDAEEGYFTLLLDIDGNIKDASVFAEKNIGYSRESLLGMTIFDLVRVPAKHRYQKMWNTVSQLPTDTFLADSIFKRKDGGLIYLRAKFKNHTAAGQPYIVVFYTVLNQIESSERAKLESDGLMVHSLIAELNTEGLILYVSQNLMTAMNTPDNTDILGKSMFEFISDATVKKLKKDFFIMAETQNTFEVPDVCFLNQDTKFDFLFTPLYHPNNQFKGFKLIARLSKV